MPYWFDGNNLIGQGAERARGDRETRRGFLQFLSACSHTRGGRFLVFFDGDDPDRFRPPAGVQVRYSSPLSTDDSILQGIAGVRVPGEIIVVTNDRALAAGCRVLGAKTMAWHEFTARVRADPRAAGATRREDGQVDLDEWAGYFGLDPDALE